MVNSVSHIAAGDMAQRFAACTLRRYIPDQKPETPR
jgi:hypothetical protein